MSAGARPSFGPRGTGRASAVATASRILAALEVTISSDGIGLKGHLARPAGNGAAPGVVICHGFPTGPRGAAASAATFPELADRIAGECGWYALAFNCRGTGASGGDFSVAGWVADIKAAVLNLHDRPEVQGVWLVGIAEGGTLAVIAAASDGRVRGCAVLAAPLNLRDWGRDPARLLAFARRVGMVRTAGFPASVQAWSRGVAGVDALAAAPRVAPRPLFVMMGSADAPTAIEGARALAAAAGDAGELRMVGGAGRELRHDPRAVASLLGWLDRQVPATSE